MLSVHRMGRIFHEAHVGQIRDTEANDPTPGSTIRAFREERGLSIRDVAARASMSRSTVHRIESGRAISDSELTDLDAAMQSGGRLITAVTASRPGGIPRTVPTDRYMHLHPAAHSGPVWTGVWARVATTHTVVLRWGPWQWERVVEIGVAGIALIHSKGDDGLSIPLFVDVSPPAVVAAGIGAPPVGVELVDAHGQWAYMEDFVMAAPVVGPVLARMLANARRTPVELAEFLQIPTGVVLAVLGTSWPPEE